MPGLDQIEYPESNKKDSPHPLPTPGNGEHSDNEGSRNKMDGKRKDGFRQPQAFAKDIEGKQADEKCKCNAQNSW